MLTLRRLFHSSALAAIPALLLALGCGSPPPSEAPSAPPSSEGEPSHEEGTGFQSGVDAISGGDFERARGIFEQLAREQPNNARAHFYLGVAQQNLGQGEAAVASYEQALGLDPTLTEASVNLAAALLDAGDAARAAPVIERALARDPGHPGLLYNRALSASALGDTTGAVRAYREALAADADNVEIKYGYAEALVAAGSTSEARALLLELTRSEDVAVLASAARLLGRLREYAACIEALTKAIGRQASAELFVARGLCHHGKQDERAAFQDFQAGIQQDPSYAPAHYYAGMHLKARGKKAEARAALARAAELAGEGGVGKAARRALDSL